MDGPQEGFRKDYFRSRHFCSAINCSNRQDKCKTISFFGFPKDEPRCKQWVILSRREDLLDKDVQYLHANCKLCAEHFETSQFMNSESRNKLIHKALPSIFDFRKPAASVRSRKKLLKYETSRQPQLAVSRAGAISSRRAGAIHSKTAGAIPSLTAGVMPSRTSDVIPSRAGGVIPSRAAAKSMSESSTSETDNLPINKKTYSVNMTFNKHLEGLAVTLLQYRTEHFLCDALVLVDDGKLQAHSVILSAASPVFKAAFTVPNAKCIKLPNVKLKVMKVALDAIYTGRIECDDSNKYNVTDLLARFGVDVSKLEDNKFTTAYEVPVVKRENDEPIIAFNSIDQLKSEMDNITDHPIHHITSQSGYEMTSQSGHGLISELDVKISSQSEKSNVDDIIDFEQNSDQEKTNRVTKKQKKCYSKSLDKKVCRCKETKKFLVSEGARHFLISFRCQSVTPDHKKRLHEQYRSLCYRRKSLLLASLVEGTKQEQTSTTTNLPQRPKWSIKYSLPCGESGERIRVCRKTFSSVFGIHMKALDRMVRKILDGTELKERRGRKALQASFADVSSRNPDENCEVEVNTVEKQNKDQVPDNVGVFISPTTPSSECQNEDNFIDGSAKFTAMLSADCSCRQCMPNASLSIARMEIGCLYCSSVLTSFKERREHTNSQHGQDYQKREQICDICHKVFFLRRSLREHRIDFHAETLPCYLCPFCGKTLKDHPSFKRHVGWHRNAKKITMSRKLQRKLELKCDLCPEVFKGPFAVVNHKEKVHGVVQQERLFFCDRCGKRLSSRVSLRIHAKSHCHDRIKSEAPFFCNICGKLFASKQWLRKHQKKCHIKIQA